MGYQWVTNHLHISVDYIPTLSNLQPGSLLHDRLWNPHVKRSGLVSIAIQEARVVENYQNPKYKLIYIYTHPLTMVLSSIDPYLKGLYNFVYTNLYPGGLVYKPINYR